MIWFRDIGVSSILFCNLAFVFLFVSFLQQTFTALMKQGGSLFEALLFSLKLKKSDEY